MNIIGLTGRLTAEPELKNTPNGICVCSFSLAVKRPKAKDTTDFINCVAWRQSAEYLCKYGSKGDLVELSGSLQSRSYEDKNGNKRTLFEVVVDDLRVQNSRQNGQAANSTANSGNAGIDVFVDGLQANGVEFEDITTADDLPF